MNSLAKELAERKSLGEIINVLLEVSGRRPFSESDLKVVEPALRTALIDSALPKSDGVNKIAAERQRQIESEGWTPEHDDKHKPGTLAKAGANYALAAQRWMWNDFHVLAPIGSQKQRDALESARPPITDDINGWPWDEDWWKPKGAIEDLVRAGALIAAEIDRLTRALPAAPSTDSEGK